MNVKKLIKENYQTISLTIIVATLVTSLLVFLITATTQPLNQSIAVNAEKLQANDEKDRVEHSSFVTKQEVLPRLDRIENKVDMLLSR